MENLPDKPPRQSYAHYILKGIVEGVHIGFDRTCPLKSAKGNMVSAHDLVYLNYQMSGTYRKYNNFVPDYLRGRPCLRGRPRQVIIHCLERKSSSKKYTEDDIEQRMPQLESSLFKDQAGYTLSIMVFVLVSRRLLALTSCNDIIYI